MHLVWGPLGNGPLERFVASYKAHPGGIDHRLVVAFNEVNGQVHRPADVLSDVTYEPLYMKGKLDLAAYICVARQERARYLCFLNSYSEPLAGGWLEALMRHLREPGVGMVSATGSYESLYDPASILLRITRRRRFGPFPNPHLRTNAFAMSREVMLSLDWPQVRTKSGAWSLESGKRSITRQVWERGLDALVVGRDGKAYQREDWHMSSTFRSGGQSNLLVADNRTRQFADADVEERRRLAELAWGAQAELEVSDQAATPLG